MSSHLKNEPPCSPISTTDQRTPRFDAPLFNRIACLLCNYLQDNLQPDDPTARFNAFKASTVPPRTVLLSHSIPATSGLAARYNLASTPRLFDVEILIVVSKMPLEAKISASWDNVTSYELTAEARCRDHMCRELKIDNSPDAELDYSRLGELKFLEEAGSTTTVGVGFTLELMVMPGGESGFDDMHWNKVLRLLRRTAKLFFNSRGESRTKEQALSWEGLLEEVEPIGNDQVEVKDWQLIMDGPVGRKTCCVVTCQPRS